jgi:hypothetical protein
MPTTVVVENLRSAVCIAGSLAGSSPNVGPPPAEFYAQYGAEAEPDYLAQLLGDLTLTRQTNHQGLELRRRALAAAVCCFAFFVDSVGHAL